MKLCKRRLSLVVLCAVISWVGSANRAAASTIKMTSEEQTPHVLIYEQPIYAEVTDWFRPPQTFAGRGNRGLEYGDSSGHVIFAATEGFVDFAGQVAGTGVIAIEHADGVRTTYTGLSDIWVSEYDYVQKGDAVGEAAGSFHFGAKMADHYLDPQILFDTSQIEQIRPRLVLVTGSEQT